MRFVVVDLSGVVGGISNTSVESRDDVFGEVSIGKQSLTSNKVFSNPYKTCRASSL